MNAGSKAEKTGEPRELAKASLSRLDGKGGLETLRVRWNPESYRLRRTARPEAPGMDSGFRSFPPRTPGGDEFRTELFIDNTQETGPGRDGRQAAEVLRGWMGPLPRSLAPPRVLFLWGTFRFVGTIEEVEEEWIRFDPDGTPLRGRIRLLMRS